MPTKRAPKKLRQFIVLDPSSCDVVGDESVSGYSCVEGATYCGEESLKSSLVANAEEDPNARVYELIELKYTIDIKIEKA